MPRPLGSRQREVLAALCNIGARFVTEDPVITSLRARGLLDDMHRITPAGLRQLADEIESGRLVLKPIARQGREE